MTETIFEEKIYDGVLFSFVHVQSSNMEEVGFITQTAASHKVVIKTLWLHFLGAFISSIFLYSQWLTQTHKCEHGRQTAQIKMNTDSIESILKNRGMESVKYKDKYTDTNTQPNQLINIEDHTKMSINPLLPPLP